MTSKYVYILNLFSVNWFTPSAVIPPKYYEECQPFNKEKTKIYLYNSKGKLSN